MYIYIYIYMYIYQGRACLSGFYLFIFNYYFFIYNFKINHSNRVHKWIITSVPSSVHIIIRFEMCNNIVNLCSFSLSFGKSPAQNLINYSNKKLMLINLCIKYADLIQKTKNLGQKKHSVITFNWFIFIIIIISVFHYYYYHPK